MTRIILVTILFVVANNCFAQINTFYVHPFQTDINYTVAQDSHLVVRNTSTNNDKLFLFIGGSGSNTRSYRTISNFAGELGFDVINLSYINDTTAFSITNSTDSLAFDHFRQEICYGTPLSPSVTIDSLNSINTRTINLLEYLNLSFPTENWDQYFLNSITLDWSKILVGGHSQGAGHACYFGKKQDVDRVLMFSGPNDYSNFFMKSAHWLRTPGITSLNKQFTYLSLLDEAVPYSQQLTNQTGLGLYPLYDTILVDNISEPYNNSHCLYTIQNPGLAFFYHNTTVKNSIINYEVWTYMLTSEIISSIDLIKEENPMIYVFPNPTSSIINIQLVGKMKDENFKLSNLIGQIILEGKTDSRNTFSLDLSILENGIYLLNIDKKAVKIIKQ